MSEYGLKIKNIQAGSLYGYNIGTRSQYEYKDAMFVNSLFKDFIVENGLKVWKDESTRDIICIEFNFGSRSYEDEIKHLEKTVKNYGGKITEANIVTIDPETKNEVKVETLNNIQNILNKAIDIKDKFDKKYKEEIRDEFYVNGVNVEYIVKSRKGEVKSTEIIHYKMLYRTPGKAKKGSCMFINETLYDAAKDFLTMGIKIPYENSPIVEIGAYSSLVTSGIVGKVKINPKNILIVNDVDSFFKTNVISVETDEEKHCIAKQISDYEIKNTLFDGQALIDSSIFPEWGDGYILLRHHFCKMAAFNTNIQKFFQDYYGDEYTTAIVTDMFGNEHYVKDIELITTDNAMKWLKFDVPYEYWCDWVYKNNCMFGIVKTAHKSKLGNVQRMSYQMINSLDIDIMQEVCKTSVAYVETLKRDNDEFLKYLEKNKNFSNDFEVLVALCNQNKDFVRSEYFRDRKKAIIKTYTLNLKTGKVIQEGDNLVIVGSPYAMLLHSVGEDVEKDDSFSQEKGTIQCFTERFGDGEYLAEFRNPFNGFYNLGYLHNVYNEKLQKYFNLGKQIIAINMIHTDFQDRNNGSDQDSDSIYTTNQAEIVEYAKYAYANYYTIVNNIPKEKNKYNNDLINLSTIDNNLSASQTSIGESSNLAQLALTYTYNVKEQKYKDYVCILSVLAQLAIDSAKRRFDINIEEEISRIKKDMDIVTNKYPIFWTLIRPDFNKKAENILKLKKKIEKFDTEEELVSYIEDQKLKKYEGMSKEEVLEGLASEYEKTNKINKELKCPMNYLYDISINKTRDNSPLPMREFFIKYPIEASKRRTCKKIEELIQKYALNVYSVRNVSEDNYEDEDYLLLRSDFENLVEDLKQTNISSNYIGFMSWLIDRAFIISPDAKTNKNRINSVLNKNKSLFLKTLYDINAKSFLKCFKST